MLTGKSPSVNKQSGFKFAFSILLALVFVALFAPNFAPYEPYRQNLNERFLDPVSPGHFLGTDSLGRDILSRLIFGTRSAFLVGLVSTSVALLIAFPLAIISSYGRLPIDNLVMLSMDGLLAVPAILLAVTCVTVFGYGLVPVMFALGVVFSPLVTRLLRAEINRAKNQDFVKYEVEFNTSKYEIFLKGILPQILPPLIIQLTSLFALSISIEASLSFLGIGVQPPQASWGIMLGDARNYLLSSPWLAFPPGFALIITVYSLNKVGDYLGQGRS